MPPRSLFDRLNGFDIGLVTSRSWFLVHATAPTIRLAEAMWTVVRVARDVSAKLARVLSPAHRTSLKPVSAVLAAVVAASIGAGAGPRVGGSCQLTTSRLRPCGNPLLRRSSPQARESGKRMGSPKPWVGVVDTSAIAIYVGERWFLAPLGRMMLILVAASIAISSHSISASSMRPPRFSKKVL